MRCFVAALITVGVVTGCNHKIEPPALPAISTWALPKGPDGNALLMQIGNARIELDPSASDAISAVGDCADLVSYCVTASDSIASCVGRSRTCATDRPWEEPHPCCPAACKDSFQTAVDAGEAELAAFDRIFFQAPDCFPGVRAALEAP